MKKLKIVLVAGLAALVLCFGFFLPVVCVSAAEPTETSETVENSSVFDEIASESLTDEESTAEEETSEKTGDFAALESIVKEYLESKKTEDGAFDFWAVFQDAKTWVIAGIGSISGLCLAAVFAAILGHFRNKGVINTEKNVETIAAQAATNAVKGIVGNSINLDISAEVNKAVEKFMYAIKNELDGTFDMARNTEILTAEIALALSKSRVLTKEEQEHLKLDANAVMSHAQKCGATISAPATIVISEEPPEDTKPVQETAKPENGYTLNFGGV